MIITYKVIIIHSTINQHIILLRSYMYVYVRYICMKGMAMIKGISTSYRSVTST